MNRSVLLRAIMFSLLFSSIFSYADAVPLVLSHQGRLLDASDAPISGTFTIIYSIHDAPIGGTQLWTEDHVGVVVTNGLFSVELGSTVPLTADIVAGSGGGGGGGGAIRYLQVQLQGQPPIAPRTPLVSSPYSVATSRVSGDIQTAPGQISVSDALSSREIRIRSTDSLLDASSITMDQPDAQIALRITPDSTVYDQGDASGARKMVHAIHRGEDRISQAITPTTCGVAINQKGTGAEKGRIAMQSSLGGLTPEVSLVLDRDSDGDSVPEGEISQNVTPTTCGVAINQKGTGAEKNRVIMQSSVGGLTPEVSLVLDHDSDGDSVPEGEISQIVTPTSSSMAINQKGTGAEKNRTAGSSCNDSMVVNYLDLDDDGDGIAEGRGIISVKSASGTGAATVSNRMSSDANDDGVAESVIEQLVTPTTSSMAINQKGTGAEKNRTAGSSCNDSSAINYLDLDDDGDGISEAKAVSAVSSLGGGGGGAAAASYARWYVDSDDDGVPESDISQSVTPTTCGVAIKTKGTGADANRTSTVSSTTEVGAISTVSTIDEDNDGLAESDIQQHITPTRSSLAINSKGTSAKRVTASADTDSATIAIDEGGVHLAMKTDKSTGTVRGAVYVYAGGQPMVTLDSDGDGYLDNSLGIGVSPTHRIDVAGGAYCDGTNWVNASDKNSKENFETVDGGEILEKISDLEITKWNYKGDDDAQHIGPTAQDFKKTFGVGADDKSISTIDPSGIALAAIKELYAQLQAKDKEMKELREEMAKLKKEMAKKK